MKLRFWEITSSGRKVELPKWELLQYDWNVVGFSEYEADQDTDSLFLSRVKVWWSTFTSFVVGLGSGVLLTLGLLLLTGCATTPPVSLNLKDGIVLICVDLSLTSSLERFDCYKEDAEQLLPNGIVAPE
jgi:hypothetical protein